MKKTLNFLILILLSFSLQAQVYIGSGTTFTIDENGIGLIAIENMDFINDGTFTSGSSEVHFINTNGEDRSISGSSNSSFDYLNVEMDSRDLILEQDIVVDQVFFQSGDVDLNGNSVDVIGQIQNESNASSFIGSNGGEIIHQTNLSAPNSINPANLGAILTTSANLGNITISRTHQAAMNDGGTSINRQYDIEPTNNSNLNATLRFSYFEKELNGQSENALTLWRDAGAGWELAGVSNSDPSANWLELSDINAFSGWTAADASFTNTLDLANGLSLQLGDIFPNPVDSRSEFFQLPIESPFNKEIDFLLVDQTGRTLFAERRIVPQGMHVISFESGRLNTGIYFLNVIADDANTSLKLIIE